MESWMRWALLEAGTKVFEATVKKGFFGTMLNSLGAVFMVIFIIGSTQVLAGFISSIYRKSPLLVTRREILISSYFGSTAFLMQTAGILAYAYYGADFDTAVFLSTLSIIPGVLIDRVFFKDRLVRRQFVGIVMFIFSGYAMFNFPSLAAVLELPVWVFLMLASAILAAINEGFSRAVAAKIDPMTKNFWVGITAITLSLSGLTVLNTLGFETWNMARQMPSIFWVIALIMGLCSVGIVSFKLLSYKDGAYIVLKKITMNGSRLVLATLVAYLYFNERFTMGNALGIAGFFISFSLVDNKTWGFFREILKER